MKRQIEFVELLSNVQQCISSRYSAALTGEQSQLSSYIEKYIRDNDYEVDGLTREKLIQKLYSEMAEYSILTPFLGKDNIEEININAWNDIAVTYTSGKIVKLKEHFHSPQHAVDIVKRLLHHSGMIIDNAAPMSQGHLPNNTRITALKAPIVDEDVGVSVSIRLLHPSRVNKEQIVKSGNATQKMIDFLCMCMRYGISTVVAGATSSGKTTLLNALLSTIPDNKRVFTIESGSRELSLVRKKGNKVINNVVHTLSRPSDNEAYDITQEDLVVASLRFNPDIVCVGEMRDVECYSAVEASLTGHTVVSTVHAFAADAAHMRIALLCQKRFPIDFKTSLMQAGQAFPIGGTCFGIFLSNDETTGTQKTMSQAISELTSEHYANLTAMKASYTYDLLEVNGNTSINWKDVLAVYAVRTTSSENPLEVVTLDDTKMDILREIMEDMNTITGVVTPKVVAETVVTTNESGEQVKTTQYVTKKVLTVTIIQLSKDEISELYNFNDEQKEQLDELMSEEFDELWADLLGASGQIIQGNSSFVGTGMFAWPFEEDQYISSRFGTRVDPISGEIKTHGGTDIAAPLGTPILAAADGVVVTATWHNSYGYYVKIKHDDTYSTLYAHCSALHVSVWQTVKQGQVIADCGSTGYSTGPHCHFEVIQNGVRVDALNYYK